MSDNKKLEALLKQYEILLSYSTSTVPASKNAILAYGLAAIGAIFAGTTAILAYGKNDELCIASFLFVIPAACLCLLFIWLGEIHRMLRVGGFVGNIEDRLNREFKDQVLYWERYIRQKQIRIRYPEIFVISIFLGTGSTSILCGLSVLGYTFSTSWIKPWHVITYAILFCFAMVIGIFIVLRRLKRYEKIPIALKGAICDGDEYTILL